MNPVFVILVGIGCLILFIILMPLFAKIGDKIIKRWNDTFNYETKDNEEEDFKK